MLKNVFTALLFLTTINCFAQQNYFVLIQADNNQPFYAMVNGKALSSSDMGHLIIPKLKDSDYIFTIGFPKDIFPERKFSIAINKKDQSYQLKNLAEKGWALFNTSTMELKMPDKADIVVAKPAPSEQAKKEDAFTRLMAGVVNDTSVMHSSYVEEEPKKETENVKNIKPAIVKVDSPLADNKKINVKDTLKKQVATSSSIKKLENKIHKADTLNNNSAIAKPPLYRQKDSVAVRKKSSFVKKLTEQKTDSSLHLVYADILNKGGIDTVDVFIALDEGTVVPALSLPKKDTIKKEIAPVVEKEIKQPKDTFQSSVINKEKENVSIDSMKKDTVKAVAKETPKVQMNKDCKNLATDYDIDKLRIKMLAIDNDDDRIIEARNVFRQKCFSVKQVTALSEVFKTDEGKYKLLDAVYVHVSNIGNFIQLQQLLTDPYYINRFKAMIR
jgi:hypothetical protein